MNEGKVAPRAKCPSLRRHDPDQVRRVTASLAESQPCGKDTPWMGEYCVGQAVLSKAFWFRSARDARPAQGARAYARRWRDDPRRRRCPGKLRTNRRWDNAQEAAAGQSGRMPSACRAQTVRGVWGHEVADRRGVVAAYCPLYAIKAGIDGPPAEQRLAVRRPTASHCSTTCTTGC